MKAPCIILTLLAAGLFYRPAETHAQFSVFKSRPRLTFTENRGQIRDQYGRPRKDIGYQVCINKSLNLFVGAGLLQYQWNRSDAPSRNGWYKMHRLDMHLLGANANAVVKTERRQRYHEQYYLSGIATTVQTYQKLTYQNIYPNIDWVIRLDGGTAEYDFVVRPGGKVSDIRMQYGGADQVRLEPDGSITASNAAGDITEGAPLSYASGKRIASAFTLQNNTIGFKTAPYSGTLVIDPTLRWGTYIGAAAE
jgi:hypothetical protein